MRLAHARPGLHQLRGLQSRGGAPGQAQHSAIRALSTLPFASAALIHVAPLHCRLCLACCTTDGSSGALQIPPLPPMKVVISGPSGVGKDAVIKALQASRPNLHFVVTATSRHAGLSCLFARLHLQSLHGLLNACLRMC